MRLIDADKLRKAFEATDEELEELSREETNGKFDEDTFMMMMELLEALRDEVLAAIDEQPTVEVEKHEN